VPGLPEELAVTKLPKTFEELVAGLPEDLGTSMLICSELPEDHPMARECRGDFGCQYMGDGDWRHTYECVQADERWMEHQQTAARIRELEARVVELEKETGDLTIKLLNACGSLVNREQQCIALRAQLLEFCDKGHSIEGEDRARALLGGFQWPSPQEAGTYDLQASSTIPPKEPTE
jgi:hypothetical protein